MQHIQDKEFDQLFKDRFEGAEIEPSANLWAGIETRLEVKKQRLFPLFKIAAAIGITALTAGLLFYTQRPDGEINGSVIASNSVVTVPAAKAGMTSSAATVLKPVEKGGLTTTATTANGGKATVSFARVKSVRVMTANKDLLAAGRSTAFNEATVKTIDNSADETAELYAKKVLLAVQPLKDITHLDNEGLVVKQKKMGLPASSARTHEVVVMANLNADASEKDEVSNENEQANRKGIRNIGDLVNYVVNKVDKREEKFLQFKTDDETSSLVALNIGIFKFNKKKK